MDDFDPITGESTMQLVETTIHQATYPHYGSANQFARFYNIEYKGREKPIRKIKT